MVVKSRDRYTVVPVSLNGELWANLNRAYTHETMTDSSESGSARTDVDAVDRYLSTPGRNVADFQHALEQSYKTAGDAGIGEFSVDRTFWRMTPWSGSLTRSDGWVTDIQNWMPALYIPDSAYPALTPYVNPSVGELTELGETLYGRAVPNEDQGQLAQFLGEIVLNPVRALAIPGKASAEAVQMYRRVGSAASELRRSSVRLAERRLLMQSSRDAAVAAADDYLAYIFGVRPTVSDLDDLATLYNRSRRSGEAVVHLAANERRIRRRRSLNSQELVNSSVRQDVSSIGVGEPMEMWKLKGTLDLNHSSTQRSWWSGSFRMPISDTDDWLTRCSNLFREFDRLSGMGLDARAAWDLVPFSFMVDWFANTGDCLSNRQQIADYNIVCEYGYVMCHTRESREMSLYGTMLNKNDPPANWGRAHAGVHYEKVVETKRRRRCGSYGFHTDFSTLNSFQWGALTALGLSVLPGIPPTIRR